MPSAYASEPVEEILPVAAAWSRQIIRSGGPIPRRRDGPSTAQDPSPTGNPGLVGNVRMAIAGL